MQQPVNQCADDLLDVIPLVMRSIRTEMRSHRSPDLTVPQFRTLAFTGINTGATLSDLADHLGLMPPAASKIVDGLVAAGLIERLANKTDRRRIWLALTPAGRVKLENTRLLARKRFAEICSVLTDDECRQISVSMMKLRHLFLKGQLAETN